MLVSVRDDDLLGKKLESLYKKTHRTKSFYVKEALINYLEDIEDIYLIESRLANLKSGKDSILSSKEFWNGLDS